MKTVYYFSILTFMFLSTSYSYAQEVLNITNEKLYSKQELIQKLNEAIKSNDYDKITFYKKQLEKFSNKSKTKNNYTTIIENPPSKENNLFNKREVIDSNDLNTKTKNIFYYSYNDAISHAQEVTHLNINSRYNNSYYIGSYKYDVYDKLPPDIYLLKNLISLDISMNKLRDISDIYYLSNLENLNLSNNIIESIPYEITKLTRLRNLDISSNNIKDLPNSIRTLSNLESLNLNSNLLNKIPESIFYLNNLEFLSLKGNYLIEVPYNITNLKFLKDLNIDISTNNNLLMINSLINIFKIKSLMNLDISLSKEVNLPTTNLFLKKIKNVKITITSDSNYTEYLNGFLPIISNAESLNVNKVKQLPTKIKDFKFLKELVINNSYINILPKEIKYLYNLRKLEINITSIESIPEELNNLKNIEEIILNNNVLLRSLPTNLYMLTNLKKIYLNNSEMLDYGKLIKTLLQLDYLEELHLEHNNIIELPDDIGKLSTLKELSLRNNKITKIPDSISKLSLSKLYLSGNNLSKKEQARIILLLPNTQVIF